MSSNYEWHKFETQARLRARLQQAEAHHQAKQGGYRTTPALSLPVALVLGVVAVIWLLAGCTPAAALAIKEPARLISWSEIAGKVGIAPEAEVEAVRGPAITMADRIRVQDLRERNLSAEPRLQIDRGPAITMADRIRLQDKRERNLWAELRPQVDRSPTITMADRIRLQDQRERNLSVDRSSAAGMGAGR